MFPSSRQKQCGVAVYSVARRAGFSYFRSRGTESSSQVFLTHIRNLFSHVENSQFYYCYCRVVVLLHFPRGPPITFCYINPHNSVHLLTRSAALSFFTFVDYFWHSSLSSLFRIEEHKHGFSAFSVFCIGDT